MLEQTENQELMVIMQFWRKYSRLIIIGLVFCAVFIVGGNYWRNAKANDASAAAQLFQEMVNAELQHDVKATNEKGEKLIADFANTPYAQFAKLLMAKISVSEENLDSAADSLRWVIKQNGANSIASHLATVRLVGVLIAQNKLDEALALVAKDPEKAYLSLYAQARGDVYVAKGDIEQAKKAYMLALQSVPMGMQAPILQMKLLDLGGDEHA